MTMKMTLIMTTSTDDHKDHNHDADHDDHAQRHDEHDYSDAPGDHDEHYDDEHDGHDHSGVDPHMAGYRQCELGGIEQALIGLNPRCKH